MFPVADTPALLTRMSISRSATASASAAVSVMSTTSGIMPVLAGHLIEALGVPCETVDSKAAFGEYLGYCGTYSCVAPVMSDVR